MSDFEGHTPGPWRWEINPNGRQIQLCGGKPEFDLSVMDFVRWGMNGAQPRVLKLDGRMELMHKAEEFAVVAPKREHHAHWFQLLNHPDLNLMAAAPTLLRERDEARAMVAELLTIVKNEEWTPWDGTAEPVWCRSCHGHPSEGHKPDCGKASAIAKAEALHA